MSAPLPLVSIGVPIRNGADRVRHMLASIDRQTYPRIEVLISDNASIDRTAEVIAEYAARRAHVRHVRQSAPLTMWQNHEAVFRMAAGEYFMWAADDDILGEDWVESLVAALVQRPDACLAFGDIVIFDNYGAFRDGMRFPHDPSTNGMPLWRRLLRDRHGGYEVEGLFRVEALRGYRFRDHTVSPDWPVITHVLAAGEVLYVPGPVIYLPNVSESGDERALVQSFGPMERFPTLTLSWASAQAANDAARQRGSWRCPPFDFLLIFAGLLWANRRSLARWAIQGVRARRTVRASAPIPEDGHAATG